MATRILDIYTNTSAQIRVRAAMTLVVGFALILSTTLRGERDVHRTIVVFLAVMSL